MMISFNPSDTTVPSLPNTLPTEGMLNNGRFFAQPTQAFQFGAVPTTTLLTPQSSQSITPATIMALNPQTLQSNGSIFTGMAPTTVISPTGGAIQTPFQFTDTSIPTNNTVAGVDLNGLETLLQQSNQVASQNPPTATIVMPRSAEIPAKNPNIADAILELQQPTQAEDGNTAKLQAQANKLEEQLAKLKEEKSTSPTQKAFASSPSPDDLQEKIVALERQIADFKSQKKTTDMQAKIDYLEKQLKGLNTGSTPRGENPKGKDKTTPVITSVKRQN